MGGDTNDSGITNNKASTSKWIPIIVMYKGASFAYSWGIYVEITSGSSSAISISISSDGSFVLAQIENG